MSEPTNEGPTETPPERPKFSREAFRRRPTAVIGAALRRMLRIASERPRATVWAMLATTCALFVVAVAATAAMHVDRWTEHTGGGASMIVYLGETVDETRATSLVAELRMLPGVERAELVPPAESARRLQLALGADTALLDGVELGSLPASVEVVLAPGVRDVVAISPTVRALRDAPGVDDVVVEDAGDQRTATALSTLRMAVWAAAALFAGLAILMVLGVLRVHLDRAGDDEPRVARMFGAHPTFIAVPTAMAGAMLGLLSALIAATALVVALRIYSERIVSALAGSLGSIELAAPDSYAVALFLAGGAMLGLVAGGLAGASRASR